MDYISCTCSTNQWLSHILKINQEDHTHDLWSEQGNSTLEKRSDSQ